MSKKKNIAHEQLRRCSTQKGGYRSRGRICVSPFARGHEDGGRSLSDDSKIGQAGSWQVLLPNRNGTASHLVNVTGARVKSVDRASKSWLQLLASGNDSAFHFVSGTHGVRACRPSARELLRLVSCGRTDSWLSTIPKREVVCHMSRWGVRYWALRFGH